MILNREIFDGIIIYDFARIFYFMCLLISSPTFCRGINFFFAFPIICITCKYQRSRVDPQLYRRNYYDDIPILLMLFIFYTLNFFDNCSGTPILVLSIITYIVISMFYMIYMYNNCVYMPINDPLEMVRNPQIPR